jgi:hypothetical protein
MRNRSVPADAVLPHLTYQDVAAALAWLTTAFGDPRARPACPGLLRRAPGAGQSVPIFRALTEKGPS